MKRVLIACVAALALSACETATPYQPITAQRADTQGGYSEQQIEANRWKVEFAGNSITSQQTVERYLLYRSAQLTLKQGYDWFQSIDRHTNRQTSVYSDPDPYYAGFGDPYFGFYRPGFGWGYGYFGDPFFGGAGGGFNIEQVTRYNATVEILMQHGAKPADNPHAYDARSVIEHLQGSIQYPKP